jgi:flagellar hook-associated protein FlgK
VAAAPTGAAERQGLVGAAKALATVFATASRQLSDASTATFDEARDVAGTINQTVKEVATLNERIRQNVGVEGDLVGLVDQRDALLTELSESLDIQVVSQDDGSVPRLHGGRSASGDRQRRVHAPGGQHRRAALVRDRRHHHQGRRRGRGPPWCPWVGASAASSTPTMT